MVVAIFGAIFGLFCGDGRLWADDASPTKPSEADVLHRRAEYARHALTQAGDPARGAELFRHETRSRCAVCHKVNGQGGAVGPDLSAIGGKFDRPHLIESLLEPSRQIVEGFRASVVLTADGLVRTGLVTERGEAQIVLIDALAQRHDIPAADIEALEESMVSLMPEGLMDTVTADEFADLIAYLESLRPGGKLSPGEGIIGHVTLPEGFEIETVLTGLSGCTAFAVTPDGRLLICEQTGALRVVADDRLLPEPFVTVPVDSTWERGLLGVTIDPEFPQVPYVYLNYVVRDPYPHHRISRFRAEGNVAAAGSEQILFEGDDQRLLGGKVPAGHQGGGLHFGTDGKLYVGIGEQTAMTPSQQLNSLLGKILRINPDGSIPEDNPFVRQTTGKYRAIWATGLRNPFTFAVNPRDGVLWINDVGGKYEEINRGSRGANFGWPVLEHGPTFDRRFHGPVHYYPQASISGGDFCPAESDWPQHVRGRYFFADFVHGWIHTLSPEEPGPVESFVTGLRRPVDLRFAPDGGLYVLLRNAWVIDDKFQGGTGSLMRIRPRRSLSSGSVPNPGPTSAPTSGQ